MPSTPRCNARTSRGDPCQVLARGENGLCLWHDPELAEVAREARRLGGQRRKREATVQAAYDIAGLTTIPEIRRIVEIAVSDLLGAENTVQRARTLLSAAQVAARLLETGEFEARLEAIESVIGTRLKMSQKKGRP